MHGIWGELNHLAKLDIIVERGGLRSILICIVSFKVVDQPQRNHHHKACFVTCFTTAKALKMVYFLSHGIHTPQLPGQLPFTYVTVIPSENPGCG